MVKCERLAIIHVVRDPCVFGVEHISKVIERIFVRYHRILDVQTELRASGNFPYVSDFFEGTFKSRLPNDVSYSLADLADVSLVEFPLRH